MNLSLKPAFDFVRDQCKVWKALERPSTVFQHAKLEPWVWHGTEKSVVGDVRCGLINDSQDGKGKAVAIQAHPYIMEIHSSEDLPIAELWLAVDEVIPGTNGMLRARTEHFGPIEKHQEFEMSMATMKCLVLIEQWEENPEFAKELFARATRTHLLSDSGFELAPACQPPKVMPFPLDNHVPA